MNDPRTNSTENIHESGLIPRPPIRTGCRHLLQSMHSLRCGLYQIRGNFWWDSIVNKHVSKSLVPGAKKDSNVISSKSIDSSESQTLWLCGAVLVNKKCSNRSDTVIRLVAVVSCAWVIVFGSVRANACSGSIWFGMFRNKTSVRNTYFVPETSGELAWNKSCSNNTKRPVLGVTLLLLLFDDWTLSFMQNSAFCSCRVAAWFK